MKRLAYILVMLFIGCATAPRYTHDRYMRSSTLDSKKRAMFSVEKDFYQEGTASFYAHDFNGKKTANGEIYNMYDLTCAHKDLPFNTVLLVTNLENGKKVRVRVNDRGPFVHGRIVDLSLAAAKQIGLIQTGTANVRIQKIE